MNLLNQAGGTISDSPKQVDLSVDDSIEEIEKMLENLPAFLRPQAI